MQIKRTTLPGAARYGRAFCALECDGCTGMCLPLFMMLTRDEQEEMCRRYRLGETPGARH